MNCFTRELCPMPSFDQLNSLKLDAPSIFQLMGRSSSPEEQGLTIYNYDESSIVSVESARQNKEAVFNSIFDITEVNALSESYKLQFAQ
ncbi:unnamed protein product [Mucor hiemalis]